MTWSMLDYEYERVGDVESVNMVFGDGSDRVEVMSDIELQGGIVVLTGCHVGGSAANRIGVRRLLELVRWVRQELGIDELRIEGAIRTSGAGPGRRPHPLVFR